MKNQVQLIAYVDRFSGGGLRELQGLLDGPLTGLFGGVHLLPFFWPIDGADAGFDPIDHTKVDPRLGSWDDIRSLSRDVEIMADLIVNHISDRSPQFLDFQQRGEDSPFAGMFLTSAAFFPKPSASLICSASIARALAFPLQRRASPTALSICSGPPSLPHRSTSTFAIPRAGST